MFAHLDYLGLLDYAVTTLVEFGSMFPILLAILGARFALFMLLDLFDGGRS